MMTKRPRRKAATKRESVKLVKRTPATVETLKRMLVADGVWVSEERITRLLVKYKLPSRRILVEELFREGGKPFVEHGAFQVALIDPSDKGETLLAHLPRPLTVPKHRLQDALKLLRRLHELK